MAIPTKYMDNDHIKALTDEIIKGLQDGTLYIEEYSRDVYAGFYRGTNVIKSPKIKITLVELEAENKQE